jgi:hypothetical protein
LALYAESLSFSRSFESTIYVIMERKKTIIYQIREFTK